MYQALSRLTILQVMESWARAREWGYVWGWCDCLSIIKQLVCTHTVNEGHTETVGPAGSVMYTKIDSCTRLLVYPCVFVNLFTK